VRKEQQENQIQDSTLSLRFAPLREIFLILMRYGHIYTRAE
jgi:hypothetical protein